MSSKRRKKPGFSSTSRSVTMTVVGDDGDVAKSYSGTADIHNDVEAEKDAKRRRTDSEYRASLRIERPSTT